MAQAEDAATSGKSRNCKYTNIPYVNPYKGEYIFCFFNFRGVLKQLVAWASQVVLKDLPAHGRQSVQRDGGSSGGGCADALMGQYPETPKNPLIREHP